jgi:hypothetical protein
MFAVITVPFRATWWGVWGFFKFLGNPLAWLLALGLVLGGYYAGEVPEDAIMPVLLVALLFCMFCRFVAVRMPAPNKRMRFSLPKMKRAARPQRTSIAVKMPGRRASPDERTIRARLPADIQAIMS